MAVAFWRQRRTWTIQQIDFNREMASQALEGPAPYRAAIAFDALCNKSLLDKSHRYETTYDRQYERALAKLQQLQAHRAKTVGLPDPPPSVATSNWAEELADPQHSDLRRGPSPTSGHI